MKRNRNHRANPRRRSSSAFEPLEGRRMFAAGALDTSFSLDGKATVMFSSGATGFANDVAVQADGKTVVVGSVVTKVPGGSDIRRISIVRFNPDGSPDTTFGQRLDGKVTTFAGNQANDFARAVTIQPDGKIVVVGDAKIERSLASDGFEMFVLRLLPDGSLDKTFDGDGKRTVRVKGSSSAHDVALQRDGKIVIAGGDYNSSLFSTNFDFAVARLNPNGSLDGSFADGGKRTIPMGEDEFARAVAIDYSGTAGTNPNFGKIVLAGNFSNFTSRTEFAMARLNINGGLDNTFDGNGQLAGKFRGYSKAFVGGLTIQPNGKYVIAGHAIDNTSTDDTPITLARYNPNGTIDKTFGAENNGFAYIDFGGKDQGDDVIQSNDGGLIVAGTSNGRFALAKLSGNGVLNTNFGTGGKVITSFGADGQAPNVGLANGARAQFVVAGGSFHKTARYLQNGGTLVTVSSSDTESVEGSENTATFTVRRSQALPVTTRVFFSIGGSAARPGSFTSTTSGPIDYSLNGMSVTTSRLTSPFVDIPANKTTATVTLTPTTDTVAEMTETARFTIAPSSAYDIGSPEAVTLTIVDKDRVILIGSSSGQPSAVPRSLLNPSMVAHAASARRLFSEIRIDELL